MNSEQAVIRRTPLARFLSYVRPHSRMVAGAAVMGIGKFTLPLAFPLAFKYVIDVLLVAHPKPDQFDFIIDRWCGWLAQSAGFAGSAQDKLAVLSFVLLMLYGLQSIASYYRNYWAGLAGNRLIFELQCRLFAHLQRLSHSFFDRNPSGGIVSRVLNDVQQARELVNSALIDVWMDAASLGLVVFVLFAMNWRLALVALCIAPLWVGLMRHFSPRIKAVSHRVQETVEDISGEVQERIARAGTIKSFGREEYEIDRFTERTGMLCECTIEKVRIAARQEMFIQLLTRCAPAIVVWMGALFIMHGVMTIGTLVAFFTYLGFLYLPLERFAQFSVTVSSSMAAIERIFEFLDLKPEIVNHPLSQPFPIRRGAVQFDHVTFCYPPRNEASNRPTLLDINLYVPPGCRVALVGRSGAGKSTLSNLIPRFYDVSGGRVLIDGKDVRHYTLRSLRDSISLVAQDALLFSASIRDNLLYARPDADDTRLWQVLELANMREFIEELPGGLDTLIGERGVRVSGGQAQRLALARAFLKDSRIVILDEATSAVDSESENLIHEAMERLNSGQTVFLIAHRLRSAQSADLIVVLERSTIVETGTHRELLRRGGTYARLFSEQARGLALDPALAG